jgi:hypothetical protein
MLLWTRVAIVAVVKAQLADVSYCLKQLDGPPFDLPVMLVATSQLLAS